MVECSQPGLEVQSVQSSQAPSRKDAVLVFGASGRLGKQVVAEVMMDVFGSCQCLDLCS